MDARVGEALAPVIVLVLWSGCPTLTRGLHHRTAPGREYVAVTAAAAASRRKRGQHSIRCVRFVFLNESDHDHATRAAGKGRPRLRLQVQAERQSWRGAARAHSSGRACRACMQPPKKKKAALSSFLFPPEETTHAPLE
jgi:hypothetical protein